MTALPCLDRLDDVALDHLPYGVVRLDAHGRVEHVNRAEIERTGTQRWRVLGRNYYRELAGMAGPELAARVAAVAPGQHVQVRQRLVRYRRVDDVTIDIARTRDDRVYLCIHRER